MKEKILETEISNACETIARALRAYSNKPTKLFLDIKTRETIPEQGTDFYSFEVYDIRGHVLLDLGRRIAYCWDDDNGGQEMIRETYKCYGGVDDGTEEGL